MAIVQRLFCVGLMGLGLASCGDGRSPIVSSPSVKPSPAALPIYQVYELPHSKVHTLRIPVQGNFEVTVAVSPNLRTVAEFAAKNQAIAALNGGFFDAQNEKTTAYLTQNGQIVGNPQENERLTQNPKLKPYLSQIFNRSEFRRYQCGTTNRYAIAPHDAPIPPNCELKDALGGGPSFVTNNNGDGRRLLGRKSRKSYSRCNHSETTQCSYCDRDYVIGGFALGDGGSKKGIGAKFGFIFARVSGFYAIAGNSRRFELGWRKFFGNVLSGQNIFR